MPWFSEPAKYKLGRLKEKADRSGDPAIGGCDNLAMLSQKGGPPMTFKLDEESKRRIEEINGLQDHVSAIHAEVQVDEDGQDEIHVVIDLLSSFSVSDPNVEAGVILNNIASEVHQRASDLPVSTVISFSREGEE